MHQKQNTRKISTTVSATPSKVHSFFSLIKLIAQRNGLLLVLAVLSIETENPWTMTWFFFFIRVTRKIWTLQMRYVARRSWRRSKYRRCQDLRYDNLDFNDDLADYRWLKKIKLEKKTISKYARLNMLILLIFIYSCSLFYIDIVAIFRNFLILTYIMYFTNILEL